jgi:Peroxiredoxin
LLAVGCGKKGYTVEGDIEGLAGKVMIKLGESVIAETEAVEGKFLIKGSVEHADICVLATENGSIGMLFLENGAQIKVTGKLEGNNADINITGSLPHEKLNEYHEIEDALYERLGNFPDDRENILEERKFIIDDNIEKNLGNMFGIFLLRNNYHGMDPAELIVMLDKIPAQYQNMKIVAADMRPVAEAKLRVDIGKPYTDFTLPDTEGNELALSSVIGPGKYVLLDFWASWCGPCMRELPYLLAAYETYHERGFEIFGVSLDSSRENWLNCIKDNGMDWYHVSALTRWDCPAAKLYGVSSIPASFLIGPDGNIIAKNLRGDELEENLAEIFE